MVLKPEQLTQAIMFLTTSSHGLAVKLFWARRVLILLYLQVLLLWVRD